MKERRGNRISFNNLRKSHQAVRAGDDGRRESSNTITRICTRVFPIELSCTTGNELTPLMFLFGAYTRTRFLISFAFPRRLDARAQRSAGTQNTGSKVGRRTHAEYQGQDGVGTSCARSRASQRSTTGAGSPRRGTARFPQRPLAIQLYHRSQVVDFAE